MTSFAATADKTGRADRVIVLSRGAQSEGDLPEGFDAFRAAVATNPALSVDVRRESDFCREVSRPMASLLEIIASTIGVIMGLGAVFAAMNAMYSAVSARSTEIATLRAPGYEGAPVVISVLIEAQLLALVGAVIGAAIAWLFSAATPRALCPVPT